MDESVESDLRGQLLDRRARIEGAIGALGEAGDLVRLLREVDAALERMDARTYGLCEVCKETVDDDFLLENPLIQYCLCKLTPEQQNLLQRDLDMASGIQWALLPKQDLEFGGWQTHFRYEPAGPVSGDYCDLVARDGARDTLFFLVGDVSGKGVAASFLMARLNAFFRSLIETGLPLDQIIERASRHFAEGMTSSHYATLVCGLADPSGGVEVCNAGHCPPLIVRDGKALAVEATGYPVGMFADKVYKAIRVDLFPGDTLFLYTDGLTEALDASDREYGVERLERLLGANHTLGPRALAAACLEDLAKHAGGAARGDDLTIMVIRRTG